MQRRELLKGIGAVGATIGVGGLLVNGTLTASATETSASKLPVNYKQLFNQALANDPDLIGFANVENNFSKQALTVEGVIPKDINGTFLRNGPGKHERGELRYKHLFEGDGMLQSFTIADGKISHYGKFINTPKFSQEQSAQKFLYSGPDTHINNALPVSSADMINTANTNVISVGDDLWALWEAGSPTRVNAETLEYQQQINLGENSKYASSLNGLPFSAHPKIEANGDIWNFGLNPSGHIVLYHLSANGQMKNVGIVDAKYKGGMLHDFLMTEKHLLLILPSLTTSASTSKEQQGYFSRIGFNKNQAMRVLVVNKDDLTISKQFELPAGFAFHYGNAWEESNGTIHFDASLYPNIDVLHNLSKVMMGEINNANVDAKMALFTLYPNGKATQAVLEQNSEFPRVCDHLVGQKYQQLYHLSSNHNSLWSDSVCRFEVSSGIEDKFDFGKDFLVEEHITVCPKNKEGSGYLIGTALHVPSKRTCLNIFQANNLAQGPICRAWLPYHLPLGFHGSFKANHIG
ncbi:carotenoid oxygenase family protein [Thalassotalea psychrophila]|uniref:Carotenoid oxygenase family protein n=1 Tax=Thalassotalea psychrophila TaxID=3065647 RepID=A0ABY9TUC8_9GAMM|nr:carotenoid oxygenase family protein [Colwelliaceae bacterium SQ149]